MYHVYPWYPVERPPSVDFKFADFATRQFMCMVCGELTNVVTNYTGQALRQCMFCRGWTMHSTATLVNSGK